jgi:hypothetical protein
MGQAGSSETRSLLISGSGSGHQKRASKEGSQMALS